MVIKIPNVNVILKPKYGVNCTKYEIGLDEISNPNMVKKNIKYELYTLTPNMVLITPNMNSYELQIC